MYALSARVRARYSRWSVVTRKSDDDILFRGRPNYSAESHATSEHPRSQATLCHNPKRRRRNTPRTLIDRWVALFVLAVIVVGCYFVAPPSVGHAVAFILCCASRHFCVRVPDRGRAGWASLLMTFGVAAVLLGPFVVVICRSPTRRELLERVAGSLSMAPDPPEWVGRR
jgi:hypothetical protein